MMDIQPPLEGAMFPAQFQYLLSIADGGFHFQPVADNTGVVQQARLIPRPCVAIFLISNWL